MITVKPLYNKEFQRIERCLCLRFIKFGWMDIKRDNKNDILQKELTLIMTEEILNKAGTNRFG
jgi:hypothetical protein